MKKLKEEFFNNLTVKFKPLGFKFSRNKQGFVKKTTFGQLWYTFLFYKYPNVEGFEINPVMQIRFKLIEDLFHKTSSFSEKDQKGTSTIGCSVENFLEDTTESFRKRITSKEDILPAYSFFYHLFEEVVNPFFYDYNSLESLNKLINIEPQKELSLIPSIFRGSKGLIVAKLLESDNFNILLDTYSSYYENYYNGFYKSDFDKVVDNLAFYSV